MDDPVERASHWSRTLAVCAGVWVMIIGLLAIAGWVVGNPFLVHVHSSFAPMKVNTALTLVLMGGGILNAVVWERWQLSLLIGLICTAIGGLTLAQYGSGADLRIDEWLFNHAAIDSDSIPGGMGPNTALCCTFGGLALMLSSLPHSSQLSIVAIGLFGALVIAVSGVAFFGYVSGLQAAYGLGTAPRMGAHTALGFLGVGVGALSHAWNTTVSKSREVPRWFSALTGIGALTVTLCLWQSLVTQEEQQIERLITTTAARLGDDLSLEFRSLVLPVRRAEWQWQNHGIEEEWEANVRHELAEFPGYVAVMHVTDLMQADAVVTLGTDDLDVPRDFNAVPAAQAALGVARRHNDVTISASLMIPGRDNLLMICAPTQARDEPDGFVVGLIDMSPIAEILDLAQDGYQYSVSDAAGNLLHRRGETMQHLNERWGRNVKMSLFATVFQIDVAPTQATLLAEQSLVTAWMLLAGIVVSLLLTMTIHFAQTSVHQAEALRQGNDNLQIEINIRRRAEHELQEAHRDLQMRGLQLISMTETAKSVNAAESPQDAVRITCIHTRSIIGAHQSFACCAPEGDWSNGTQALDLSAKHEQYTAHEMTPHGNGLYALVCEKNQAIRLTQDELERHPRWRGHDDQMDLPPMRGWLGVSLIAHDGTSMGIIQVSDKYAGEFTEEDEIILIQLAQLTATAIEVQIANANLESQAAELTRSNTELEQFAYVASHDLQEPLRKIVGFTDRLEEKYKGQLDDKADRYLHYINDGAGRMQQLVKDLLALSRVGRHGREFALTDTAAIVAQAVDNLEHAIADNGATVTFDALPTIMGDEIQLTQLFQNLIANAMKFRGDEPPAVSIIAEDWGDSWQFKVSDNGIGIDPQFTERIFVIFQRLHTRTEYPGTGIGLAICRKIVERHGGRIWVESEPDSGSTFYFTIPMDLNDDPTKTRYLTRKR